MRILISGYYGFGNAGDEAILAGTLSGLRRRLPDCETLVLSANPTASREAYGVQAADRWSKSAVWRSVGWADLLLQGGGGLIQDSTSARSPLYYLGILLAAQLRRTPYVIHAQGIGPLAGGIARFWLAKSAAKARAITVRDDASAKLLVDVGTPAERIVVTADPAALVDPVPPEDVAHLLPDQSRPRIGVALRDVEGCEGLVEGALAAARELSSEAHIVPLSLHAGQDDPLAGRLAGDSSGSVVGGAGELLPAQWAGVARSLDYVIAMRLHAAILAAAQGTEFIALAYDPKVRAFAQSLGAAWVEPSADASETALAIRRAWEARGADPALAAGRAEALRAAAEKNLDVIADVVKGLRP